MRLKLRLGRSAVCRRPEQVRLREGAVGLVEEEGVVAAAAGDDDRLDGGYGGGGSDDGDGAVVDGL